MTYLNINDIRNADEVMGCLRGRHRRWVYGSVEDIICDRDEEGLDFAIKNGMQLLHEQVVNSGWLYLITKIHIGDSHVANYFNRAMQLQYFDVAEHLWPRIHKDYLHFVAAENTDKLDVMRWLLAKKYDFSDAVGFAIRMGKIKFLDFLNRLMFVDFTLEQLLDSAKYSAKTFKWLATNGDYSYNELRHAFIICCMHGNVNAVRWLVEEKKIKPQKGDYECAEGYVAVKTYLRSLGAPGREIN